MPAEFLGTDFCEGSGRQRGKEMKPAKETHTKQRTHKVCRSGYTE